MFSNFIYFIIVLLIYVIHQPAEEANFSPFKAFAIFFCLIIIFSGFSRFQFHRLEKKFDRGESLFSLDHHFGTILNRQAIMAIMLFTFDVYGLNLPSFFIRFSLFTAIPTLQALLFLMLFAFYLAVIWSCSHTSYQKIYGIKLSGRSYVLSNILFAVPVLLPWLLLSGFSDIINVLPFEWPRHFLSTTEGEVIYFLFFLFIVAIAGPVLIQKSWRCRPLEAGYERNRIENLCRRAGVGYANILYLPMFGGKMITAAVMGLIRKFRYILVTDGLLSLLNPDEVDAVIAHEIGHVKKKHLLFYLFFFCGYMLLSYSVYDLLLYLIVYADPFYSFANHFKISSSTLTSALFTFGVILMFLIYFRYIFGYFMRNFERQADAYVYTLFDSAAPLISTFEKITLTSGQPADKPNWHHFSIAERVEYLRKCEEDRTWIQLHDRKIKNSIAVYLLGILLIGFVGYHLNFGETGKKLGEHFFEKMVLREIERKPDNAEFHTIFGELCLRQKNYAKTIEAYEKSISIVPDNPRVLNNLAWVYAACEDESLRNPERSLVLAARAAELLEESYILDTLAESHYVNGQFEKAVSVGERALELAGENHSYYEKQLQKFRK